MDTLTSPHDKDEHLEEGIYTAIFIESRGFQEQLENPKYFKA
jgi:hypothetical protein